MSRIRRLDSEYFNSDPWPERRSNWIKARSATSTEFEQAQVKIIAETLAKEELSPRCVVNIGADALLKFFKDGRYMNTYDLEAADAIRPFPLAGRKHAVSQTRREVDALVQFGGPPEQFYFGAVALSGSGIRFYGEYCLYLRKDVITERNPSVLDRNSYDLIQEPLSEHVRPQGAADAEEIDVTWLKATWNEDLSDMLVMKIAPTIDAENRLVTPGAVAEGVLADEDFAEVHLSGTFSPDDVEEIRFAPEEHALAADILARIDQGRPPDPAEWLWVWRRGLVDAACDEHAVRRRVTTAAGRTRRWQ